MYKLDNNSLYCHKFNRQKFDPLYGEPILSYKRANSRSIGAKYLKVVGVLNFFGYNTSKDKDRHFRVKP